MARSAQDIAADEKAIAASIAGYKPEFIEGAEFIWKDASIYYAQVYENNYDDYNGKLRFVLKIMVPEDRVQKLKASGFNLRPFTSKKELAEELVGRVYLEAYKYKVTTKNVEQKAPPCAYPDRTECSDLLGNGTVADVHVFAKYVKVGGIWRLPLYLNGLVVTNLVPYESEGGGGSNKTIDDLF